VPLSFSLGVDGCHAHDGGAHKWLGWGAPCETSVQTVHNPQNTPHSETIPILVAAGQSSVHVPPGGLRRFAPAQAMSVSP
jgi:hypothetical protein